MPGIVGACNFDDWPVDRALVPGVHVVFDGRLDNREELVNAMRDGRQVSSATSDVELAAAAYETYGTDFASRLLGDFAVAIIDARNRRVVLARDAMGIRPLYYIRTATSVLFGSTIKNLIGRPGYQARPNNQLLAELLLRRTHRLPSDGSTLFDGVSQVPPAHVAVLTAEQTQIHRYWDFNCAQSEGTRSFEECAQTFRHLFERAVVRRLRSAHPIAVAVSGGLDSSSIFCTASRAHAGRLVGLTYTPHDGGPSDESAFIAELERACGRPIRQVDTPEEGLLFQSAEMVRIVEAPMLNGQWFRGHRLMNAVTASGARTLLTGHWADQILFDQAYLVDFLRTGAWQTLITHLREYRCWFPDARDREFVVQFGSDVLEYALPRWVRGMVRTAKRGGSRPSPWDEWFLDSFQREARLDAFAHADDATALSAALYREVRSEYHHLCLEWNAKVGASYGFDMTFPFLDRDLVEFLINVPGAVLARNGVPKALLREALKGLMPDAILRRRTKADFTAAVNRSTRHGFAALVEMLGPNPLVVELGYVDAARLRRGLSAARSALERSTTSTVSWRVTAVAALELWLREFIDPRDNGREDQAWQKTHLANAR